MMDTGKPSLLRSPSNISRGISQDDTFKFRDKDFGLSILERMNENRKKGTFCDVTIHVGQHAIKGHRVVLSAFSQYFEGLLNPNMREGKQTDIEISELDGKYVELLVNFAYTSEIELSPENIQGVLETANFLAVSPVCTACCTYMSTHMNSENCVGVFQLADNYGFTDLKKQAFKCCLRHFYSIYQSGEFQYLAVPLFTEILKSESLLVVRDDVIQKSHVQEEIVLNALLQYIQSSDGLRNAYLPDLLPSVRLALVPKEQLILLKKNPLVKDSPKCQKMVDEALGASVDAAASTSLCQPRMCPGLKFKLSKGFATGGQVGSPYKTFNDKDWAGTTEHVVGMKIFIRRWDGRPVIGGLIILYSNKAETTYGNITSEEHYEFKISDDERIVKVDVNSGWMIDQLTFYTNTGQKHGPFGGTGGSFSIVKCPDNGGAYLAFLQGGIANTQGSDGVVQLRFGWGYIDYENILGDSPSESEPIYDPYDDYDEYEDYYLHGDQYSEEDYEEDSNPYISDPEYDIDGNFIPDVEDYVHLHYNVH